MAQFNPGDEVTIDGAAASILSWPSNDTGAFVVSQPLPGGTTATTTLWTGTVTVVLVAAAGTNPVVPVADETPIAGGV